MVLMLWIVVMFGAGLAVGCVAYSKGRDMLPWAVYGAVVPFVAVPHILLARRGDDAMEVGSVHIDVSSPWSQCPACGETVNGEAVACQYCGAKLVGAVERPPEPPKRPDPTDPYAAARAEAAGEGGPAREQPGVRPWPKAVREDRIGRQRRPGGDWAAWPIALVLFLALIVPIGWQFWPETEDTIDLSAGSSGVRDPMRELDGLPKLSIGPKGPSVEPSRPSAPDVADAPSAEQPVPAPAEDTSASERPVAGAEDGAMGREPAPMPVPSPTPKMPDAPLEPFESQSAAAAPEPAPSPSETVSTRPEPKAPPPAREETAALPQEQPAAESRLDFESMVRGALRSVDRPSAGIMEPDEIVVAVGEVVSQVQLRLHELGYDPGAVDGRAGYQTQEAIRRFENDEGMKPTGEVTWDLRVKLGLAEDGANRIKIGDPLPENAKRSP